MAERRILFRLFKGFLYGILIGFWAGIAIYLLAAGVESIADIPFMPSQFFGLIFGASAAAGVIAEYSRWLEAQGTK